MSKMLMAAVGILIAALLFSFAAVAEVVGSPAQAASGVSANAVPFIVPPRLSLETMRYYAAHPQEWQQFMSRLPKIQNGPPKPRPATSPWQAVKAASPASGLSNPLLLTDGTVLIHQSCTENWYKLTPDQTGSYVNATWSQAASLPSGYGPLYFASEVLPDGRVVMNGGEYNEANNCASVWTTLGAIYNSNSNVWSKVPAPSGWTTIGDAESVMLASGKYMVANCCTTQQSILNAGTLAWTATGTNKFDVNDEEGWTLLPDTTVLTSDAYVDTGTCGKNSERYTASSGAWASAGNSTAQLSDCSGTKPSYEVGPQVLRADGTVVAFSGVATGVVAGTSIFKTSTKTWTAGPNLPNIGGKNYDLADAPAAWMPNGKVLFAASPGLFMAPTHIFEYSTTNTIAQVADPPNAAGEASYVLNFLILPTGQILQTDFSSTVEIYTPTGTAQSGWAPVVTSMPTTLVRGKNYSFAGRQLNGLTQGAAYGDDAQAATNYPLIRITNKASGHVVYARTFTYSTRSIAPNLASTAAFGVPAVGKIETGASSLVVVANGVPSAPIAVTIQ